MTYDFHGKTAVVTGASRGIGAVAIEADLGAPDGWQRSSAAVLEALGEVDILVNNAGTSHPAPIGQLTPVGLDDTLMVNVRNLILLTDALSTSLIRRRGCVVNVSSVAAFSSSAGRQPMPPRKAPSMPSPAMPRSIWAAQGCGSMPSLPD